LLAAEVLKQSSIRQLADKEKLGKIRKGLNAGFVFSVLLCSFYCSCSA
jgi:hypothetical protein